MKESKVISIINFKGGVGKTTITFNLGVALAKMQNKVLLIDASPQGDLTTCICGNKIKFKYTLADLIRSKVSNNQLDIESVIIKSKEGIDLVPSNINLSIEEFELVEAISREFIIKKIIKDISSKYDYILIDSTSYFGMLSINVLSCSDSIIIPVQDHFLSLKGIENLIKIILEIKRTLNPNLKINGILLNMVNERTKIFKRIKKYLNDISNIKIYDARIPMSVKVVDGSLRGKSVYKYRKNNKLIVAYQKLANEVINNE